MSRTRKFSHSATTVAPVSVVAQTLSDADGWARWARPYIARSRFERWGTDSVVGVGSVRRVGAAQVWIRELIIGWDPAAYQTYTIVRPYLFVRYRGAVNFTELAGGGTQLTWSVEFEPRPMLSGLALKSVMSFVIAGVVARLTAECDSVHRGRKWEVRR
ncbi:MULTISPECIES: SRPBCC family protein [unclassified Rhodococcus (in: high G+C Gram-positive bacteria)]|uniref:SRPBCC family protein n=1 Tax=unclassified Rhodococcus (in: high G+C Gram-positive bacteria) TaxID=192944 RepID=UPI0015C66E15|nr:MULTISPECIES: SRPBCC family protein [unclassified Rhodococcus (in: high G+C Gram-positive bacteria)]